MPRAFTDDERARIRTSLIDAGRTCFLKYGLRKTTIDDLVRRAGIAKGSFYRFFKSKEELYLELFMEAIPEMMTRLHQASFGRTSDMREALVLLMEGIAHEMETNDLARIILDDPTEMERFLSTLEYEQLVAKIAEAYAPLVGSIRQAQERGEIIEGDPQQLVFCLGMIKFLPLYRETISEPMYESMIRLVPQVIARGLTQR